MSVVRPTICSGALAALAGLHHELADHYSHTGRSPIDPELLVRIFIVGYCDHIVET